MADFNQWINELLDRTDIVALVQKYVPLTKKGATHWACCPFHHEKTPSFSVTEAKQMFYCFGCAKGGNAITFLSEIESVDRIDAIKMLAESAGMELPQSGIRERRDTEAFRQNRARLLSLLKDCARHYHSNLSLPQAKIAAQYLQGRGIDQGLITRFGIGYSLGYQEAIDFLEQKGYTRAEMTQAGVAAQKADRHYDALFGRLIIPIINARDEVVAFGGRLLEESDFAKYKNTSNNLVFDKSKNLFAINLVKKKKQRGGLKSIIITEGYMDAISLHGAGFGNAVASMGTSLTNEQARMLKHLCGSVYISYDGDSAGQSATMRGLDILEGAGLNVKVISLPERMDPDDVIRQKGADFYRQLMENALPLTAFKIENAKKGRDLSNPEEKAAFAVEAVSIIRRLDNPVEREEYLSMVRAATGYSMQVLYKQADLPEPQNVPPPPPSRASASEGEAKNSERNLIAAREFILSQIIAAKPYAVMREDIYSLLGEPQLQRIFVAAAEASREEGYTAARLYSMIEEQDEDALTRLISYETLEGDGAEKYQSCITLLKLNLLEKTKCALLEEYKQSGDKAIAVRIKDIQDEAKLLKRR